jgi:hypothetical protein
VKLTHYGETFWVRRLQEFLGYIGPSLDDETRKPSDGMIQTVKCRVRANHDRDATEINTFIESMCVYAITSRAKCVFTFECFIIDNRRRHLLIKIRGIIALGTFFTAFWIGVIVQVIDE